jgi:alpha-beta hydrolase superfamily lysophospholipase
MTARTVEITTTDGLKLHGRQWEPTSTARSVIFIIHGLGEHCGRYEHAAKALTHEGFAVFAFDLRGHGQSEGKRGHAPGYEQLMSDISQCLKKAQQQHPTLPVFLYGHSLGGNLVIQYALRKRPDPAGVIASSPLFRPAFIPPAWKTALMNLAVGITPSVCLPTGLDTNALSQDAEVVRAYQSDPLVHDRISLRLAKDMLAAGEWNRTHAAEFPCPLLLMHGDADRITSAQASREFAAQANEQCTFKLWPGLFHELHNEPQQIEVLTRIIAWIKLRLVIRHHS